jgi:hypothetical protein
MLHRFWRRSLRQRVGGCLILSRVAFVRTPHQESLQLCLEAFSTRANAMVSRNLILLNGAARPARILEHCRFGACGSRRCAMMDVNPRVSSLMQFASFQDLQLRP